MLTRKSVNVYCLSHPLCCWLDAANTRGLVTYFPQKFSGVAMGLRHRPLQLNALITRGSVTYFPQKFSGVAMGLWHHCARAHTHTHVSHVSSFAGPPSPALHPIPSQLPEPSAQVAVTSTHPVHGRWQPRRRRFTSSPGAPSIQGPK